MPVIYAMRSEYTCLWCKLCVLVCVRACFVRLRARVDVCGLYVCALRHTLTYFFPCDYVLVPRIEYQLCTQYLPQFELLHVRVRLNDSLLYDTVSAVCLR